MLKITSWFNIRYHAALLKFKPAGERQLLSFMSKLVFQVVQMLIGLALLIWVFYRLMPTSAARASILACDMKMRHQECVADVSGGHHPAEQSDDRRIVAIGDVHGAYEGLLELLHAAKITVSASSCEWKSQGNEGVVLVQQGDLVDRGPQAWEALKCLRHLQKEAYKHGSKVVRIIGSKFSAVFSASKVLTANLLTFP